MSPTELPLKDIHLPTLPPWWPPAPGWWGLLALVLLLAIALVWLRHYRRRTRVRIGALAEMTRIAERHAKTQDAHALAAEISVLLRRLALGALPREQSAGVTGDAWLSLLDRLSPRVRLDAQTRSVLMEAPYRRDARIDGAALIDACRRWLRSLPPQRTTSG